MDILHDQWSPALTVDKIVKVFQNTLINYTGLEDCCANSMIIKQIKDDRPAFEAKVKEYILKYSM